MGGDGKGKQTVVRTRVVGVDVVTPTEKITKGTVGKITPQGDLTPVDPGRIRPTPLPALGIHTINGSSVIYPSDIPAVGGLLGMAGGAAPLVVTAGQKLTIEGNFTGTPRVVGVGWSTDRTLSPIAGDPLTVSAPSVAAMQTCKPGFKLPSVFDGFVPSP
jgi:hypothetical protein